MKRFIALFSLLFVLLFSLTSCDEEDSDIINKYDIYIEQNQDGSLNLEYYLEWKVLDDDRYGPLKDVYVGVPNDTVKNVRNLDATNVKYVEYYEDGDYTSVYCVFNKSYFEGDTVIINFSYTASELFTVKKDKVGYEFITGWFDDIKVKEANVYWAKNLDMETNSNKQNSDYYIWSYSLDYGESIEVEVQYDLKDLPYLDIDNEYDNTEDIIIIIVMTIFVVVFVSVIVMAIFSTYYEGNTYYAYRGFSGGHRIRHRFRRHRVGYTRNGERVVRPARPVNSSSGFRGGGGCACACACACAGGGRAGCSRKDFYSPKVSVEEIKKI